MKASRFLRWWLPWVLLLCSWQMAEAATSVFLTPVNGPPTRQVTVKGSGFGASETVDVFFDLQDLSLGVADGSGRFTCKLTVPKKALPGSHWITAKGRTSKFSAQRSFLVRTNWFQFRYNPKRRGYNPYENVLSPSTVSGLKVAWQSTPVNPTNPSPISSSPVVVNGLVYFGGHDIRAYAVNALTGALKWCRRVSYATVSSPAVANGVVYVGCSGRGYYMLHALNAATGAVKWTYNPGEGEGSYSPAVADGIVYFGVGGTVVENGLYALDALTGALKWKYSCITNSSPAVADGMVYFGAADGKTYALDAKTGAYKWSSPPAARYSLAVANGMVYFGSGNALYALDAKTGAYKWSYTTGGPISSSPALAYGRVYSGSFDNKLYALDSLTGLFQWSYTTGGRIESSPAVANGVVYVGSNDNKIYALDALTGAYLWSYATGRSIVSSPAVVDGRVYVASYDGKLYAFSLDGEAAYGGDYPRPDPALLVPNGQLRP